MVLLLALIPSGVEAQDAFDEFKRRIDSDFSRFQNEKNKEYDDFRKKINAEYADFLKKSWEEYNSFKGIPKPKDEPVPPVIYDDKKPIKDNPKPFDEIIPVVEPEPQPTPVAPIEDSPKPVVESHAFSFYHTPMSVRLGNSHRFTLASCNEKSVAQVWNVLSGNRYNDVINDCLKIRVQYRLCDWAYLEMLNEMSTSFFKGRKNEAVLLAAFIYCQSGYKMRLAYAGERLYMLYASNYGIYDMPYWNIGGVDYYAYDCNSEQLHICNASFPNEKPLSLQMTSEQLFSSNISESRNLQSTRYKDVKTSVSVNKNLIDFYNSYPTAMINNDLGTRWAMYANTPLSKNAQMSLYPSLKSAVSNSGQLDAVNKLLNFVQTAFEYEYDDKVWGHDRAFFADETLFYPYCDCEDRSILFSRLVRDLLGLKVVLMYYPGHLAAAVHFTEEVKGDYILLNGEKYVVCDPTYIGAPVGRTMPDMDNSSATVILLD